MAKSWLVTHPETELDKQGRIHGDLDPPLSYSGLAKAKRIGRSFASKKVSQIHSSPRVRAKQLAQEISKSTGAPIAVQAGLIPWDLGSMSGAKPGAIQPLLDYFTKHPERKIPSGESKSAVLARYTKFMKTLKGGEIIVGHSQHSLALNHARKGGDATKVPMFGGKHGAGEIKEIEV